MKANRLRLPYDDWKTRDLIQEFGGWSRVLHPSFHPSEDFLQRLAAADFSLEEFDNLRKDAVEVWLYVAAEWLYSSWQLALQNNSRERVWNPKKHSEPLPSPFDGTASWRDLPYESYCPRETLSIMNLYGITADQLEAVIVNNPEQFRPVRWTYGSGPSGEKPPPTDPARVPRRPGTVAGGAEIALPLPEPEPEEET